jgi:hypothetical protein
VTGALKGRRWSSGVRFVDEHQGRAVGRQRLRLVVAHPVRQDGVDRGQPLDDVQAVSGEE